MADPLSISASIAGLISITEAVFSRTFKYVKAVNGAPDEVSSLALALGALSGILHNLELVATQFEEEPFDTAIQVHHVYSCFQTVERVEKILDKYQMSSVGPKKMEKIKRLKWPFSVSETKTLCAEIEQHKTTLSLALNVDGMTAFLQTLSRQKNLQNGIDDIRSEFQRKRAVKKRITVSKERQKVLDWIQLHDPHLNHDMNLNLRHPGTGLWLLESDEFKTWLSSSRARLWCYGIPGAGKTVLASSVIQEVLERSSPSIGVAFYYCDYKNATTQDPRNILGSLACQLAIQDEQSYVKLQASHTKHHPPDRPPIGLDYDELCDLLAQMASSFNDVLVIVDALDECGTFSKTITRLLSRLNDRNGTGNIKTLFFSRDEQEIREILEKYEQVSIAAESSDLKLFVGAEIEHRIRNKDLRIKDNSLKEDIMKRLVEGADGMFRWVACQMDHLCELPNDAARRKALNTLPPTLHATYERIIQRLKILNKEVQQLVQRSLRWLSCSKGMLTSSALCEAISIEPGNTTLDRSAVPEEEDILRWCSSLVRKSASGKGLELAHFTVKEFLTTGIDPLNKEHNVYHIRSEVCDVELAKTCLTYLSLNDFGNGNCDSLKFSYKRFANFAFRHYAVRYWAEHARDKLSDPEVMSLTQQLLHPSKPLIFVSWTQDFLWASYDYKKNIALDLMTNLAATSPLHFAASLALPESVDWLLQKGCYIDQISPYGTPLECALLGRYSLHIPGLHVWAQKELESFRYATLRLILDHGADAQKSCIRGPSYFYVAAYLFDLRSCIELLRKGATIDSRSAEWLEENCALALDILEDLGEEEIRPEDRTTLLEAALKSEDLPTDFSLGYLSHGHRIAERTGCLKLFLNAAENGQLSVLKQLLHDHKLGMDAADQSDQRSALHLAASNDRIEVVEFLHEHGADPNLCDRQGRTPLLASVENPGRYLCFQFFVNQNVDTHITDNEGLSAWHFAALQGNAHALNILQKSMPRNQTCPRLKDDRGRTPLHCAAQSCSKETLIFLLDHSDKDAVHDESLDGLTAMHYSVEVCSSDTDSKYRHCFDALQVLLEYGANPATEDLMGNTALANLVKAWEKLFLERGCDVVSFDVSDKFAELFDKLLENTKENKCHKNMCTDPHLLCLALIYGEEALAKKILKYFPSVDMIAHRILQMSPLQAACYYGSCSCPLLEELHRRSKAERGAGGAVSGLLLFACDGDDWNMERTVTKLLALGSDPNERSAKGRTVMMLAAKRGHVTVVKILIAHGADVSAKDNNGWSVTHYACQSGNEDLLYSLKSIATDWNAKIAVKIQHHWYYNATALHLAASLWGHALHFLLTNDLITAVNSLTQGKETALWMAAFFGIPDNVSLLLDHGGDTAIKTIHSEAPLHVALRLGHLKVVRIFIDKGCDLHLQDGSGLTPQLIARKYGHLDIVEALKERQSAGGTSGCQRTDKEEKRDASNLLNLAIELGDMKLCQTLMNEGVDTKGGSSNFGGRTPVLYALDYGQYEIAGFLISKGASIVEAEGTKSYCRGWTPFHHAAFHGLVQILRLLFEKAPRVIVRCCQPVHPIHLAIANGHAECVELIIDHARKVQGKMLSDHVCSGTYNLDHVNEVSVHEVESLWPWLLVKGTAWSQTDLTTARPLHIAAHFGYLDIVRSLINHGASVDGVDDQLWTPLHFAARKGQNQAVKLLIRSGANANALNNRLKSPCILAAEQGFLEPIQTLIEGGADLLLQDQEYWTALYHAAWSGHRKIVVFLMTNTEGYVLNAESLSGESILSLVLDSPNPSFILNLAPDLSVYEPHRSNVLTAVVESKDCTRLKMLMRRLPKALVPTLLAHRAEKGGTPLYAAATQSAERCIDVLLDTGADLELEGGNHGTPLMGACATGRLEIVKALVRKGAKTSYIKDGQVFSALSAAKHHAKVRQWLLVGRFMEGPLLIKDGKA